MPPYQLNLSVMPRQLAICQLAKHAQTPDWALTGDFYSITKTPEELSIVCDQDTVPPGIKSDPGWVVLKVEGPLDFSLTGILASLATSLAQAGIPIFALSTYNTDYLLVKESNKEKAISVLSQAGHTFR